MSQPTQRGPRRVGLEHEFRVLRAGRQIDFREVLHTLPIDGARIDPGDAHAYRLTSGLKLTCDGPEAEIATPPVQIGPGFARDVVHWSVAGAALLVELLERATDGDHVIEGVSTHLSVSIDDSFALDAAGVFSRTFAPSLMLLTDHTDSPGLLVRPRHRRLEFGGEYVAGKSLEAALTMAAGATIVCEQAAASPWKRSRLPPPIEVEVVSAVDRFGWYVDRAAFGLDLYAEGRAAVLRRERRGTVRAQDHLAASWRTARRALRAAVSRGDLRAGDDAVRGTMQLPVETDDRTTVVGPALSPPAAALGRAITQRSMGKWTVAPVVATWDYVVFQVTGTARAYVSVPTPDLDEFISAVESGEAEEELERLVQNARMASLQTFGDGARTAAWPSIRLSPALAPPERGPGGEWISVLPAATP